MPRLRDVPLSLRTVKNLQPRILMPNDPVDRILGSPAENLLDCNCTRDQQATGFEYWSYGIELECVVAFELALCYRVN